MHDIPEIKPRWAQDLPEPPKWASHGDSVMIDTPWMQVTRHPATAPTGAAADYQVVRPKNVGTGVLPLHEDGTVTMVGQHRFALMRYSWEMPEGGAPMAEDPFDAVRRELAEEAGLAAEHWRAALDMDLSNSITDERAMTWVAWGLSAVPVDPDPTEVIVSVRVPFRDLLAEIERGAVRDSLTVATAYKAYHMAREGELPAALAQAMLGA
ncbi:NUDIX domain-containing protein [Brevundimonas faecalis]|uniref:NUDIX domain-containing protein n=1 Tax=Brevundimonas faecalis TaxID=947378 RepID=UPI00360FE6ED